jgi:hypothetical protein
MEETVPHVCNSDLQATIADQPGHAGQGMLCEGMGIRPEVREQAGV